MQVQKVVLGARISANSLIMTAACVTEVPGINEPDRFHVNNHLVSAPLITDTQGMKIMSSTQHHLPLFFF